MNCGATWVLHPGAGLRHSPAMPNAITISPVRTAEGIAAVAALFRAYAASLPVSLAYQDFDGELAGLPGRYAEPRGVLLLARGASARAIGCAALRPLQWPQRCEMKRLYVAPAGRGSGLGRSLAEVIISTAAACGYREIVLDTLPSMTAAQQLYLSLGFTPVEPYYSSAPMGTVFLGRCL